MARKTTLKEKLVAVQEAHVAEEIAEYREEQVALDRDSILMILGGIRAVHAINEALNSQTIRALQHIRDERVFTTFPGEDGQPFKRFDDFLDKSPYSPMNYKKFNQLENLLLSEGDELFNYMQAINGPIAHRRALGRGSLTIEGEEAVVKFTAENGTISEERMPVDDRKALLTVLSKIADQNNERGRTIERGKKELERKDKKLAEALKPKEPSIELTPFVAARHSLFLAFDAVINAARSLEAIERAERRTETLALLQPLWLKLHETFDIQTAPDAASKSGLTDNVTEADMQRLVDDLEAEYERNKYDN